MEKKFNKKEYDIAYMKEHKSQFKVSLNKDEMIEMNELLKKHRITKTDFVRNSFKKLKEELEMKKIYRIEEENCLNGSIADLQDYDEVNKI